MMDDGVNHRLDESISQMAGHGTCHGLDSRVDIWFGLSLDLPVHLSVDIPAKLSVDISLDIFIDRPVDLSYDLSIDLAVDLPEEPYEDKNLRRHFRRILEETPS